MWPSPPHFFALPVAYGDLSLPGLLSWVAESSSGQNPQDPFFKSRTSRPEPSSKRGYGIKWRRGWYVVSDLLDIRYVPFMQISEHFHLDHRDYYEPFMEQYKIGSARQLFLSDI